MNFQNWQHCGYEEWFMIYEVVGACLVFILYQGFASTAWMASNHYIGIKVHSKNYWYSLAVVFHLCGILHFTKSLGLVCPNLKIVALVYPVLVVAMVSLLFYGVQSYIKWDKTFKGK